MVDKPLFKKPKNMTYTDLAIWVDKHFYEPDCDYEFAFNAMWSLGYMLAAKNRYFFNKKDYEDFAAFIAYSTYQRMIDKNKSPIKSVLNYMKSILYFRKALFVQQRHQEIINPLYDTTWDSQEFLERKRVSLECSNRSIVEEYIFESIGYVPNKIKYFIPKRYKKDKLLYKNIYTSCLLSLINRFSLPNRQQEILDTKLDVSPTFDEVKFYSRYLDKNVILWHLDAEMEAVVIIIVNKTCNWLVEEISEAVQTAKISEEELAGIMSSAFDGGGYETDY